MLGNLFRECGCTDRLSDTVQNALMNIVTIFLSTSVGATMVASNFLKPETLKIIFLGLVAFGISTAGGLIGGNIMCKLSGKKVNPLIGSAGVSAVPMAARVSQMVGQKANPANFLLMHAMGPNVAGVPAPLASWSATKVCLMCARARACRNRKPAPSAPWRMQCMPLRRRTSAAAW